MEFRPDWEAVQRRYEAWWARENHDRPLVLLTTPRDGVDRSAARAADRPRRSRFTAEDWRAWWWDTERVMRDAEAGFAATRYFAEALPVLNPNLGPDYFAACYGTELEFGADTSWALPSLSAEDIEAGWQPQLDPHNPYRRKMRELTSASVEAGRGRWLTGITDLHPGLDALVSMRGAEAMCMDLMDYPEEMERLPLALFEGMREITEELAELIETGQKGHINWMSCWHPGRWYVTSCDALALISTEAAERFVWPELRLELQWLDASLFHLDGPDALRHLDALLAMPDLAGIQWVYGAGQPTARHWLELLQQIQAAGKNIWIDVPAEDLDAVVRNLDPEGLLIVTRANSEDEGRRLMRLIEEASTERRRRGTAR